MNAFTQEKILPKHQGESVSLTNINKTYGKNVALPQINLEVQSGEFCTLLGASGSGKTTLLKIIAGFELPNAGQVKIANRNVTQLSIAERNIGMVFQNYALFPNMSVYDNVAFSLKMRRYSRQDIKKQVDKVLELVSLTEFAKRLPRELSGGQQQRVSLARALIYTPDVLLMDEPLGALDKNLRQGIQLQLKKLQQELGLTIIFVTHDQEEAMTISDKIVIMDKGEIIQVGQPQALYYHPVNPFVAGFLGECNFITSPDKARMIAIRPEFIHIITQQDADHWYNGTVITCTFLGPYWKIFIKWQEITIICHLPSNQFSQSLTAGQTIGWGFQAKNSLEFAL